MKKFAVIFFTLVIIITGCSAQKKDTPTGPAAPVDTATITNTPTFTVTPTTTCTPTPTTVPTVCMQVVGFNLDTYNDSIPAHFLIATSITASADFTITKLQARGVGDVDCNMGIYTDDSGKPGTLIAQTGQVAMTNGLNTYAITPVNLYLGTTYWLAVVTSGTGVARDTTATSYGMKSVYYSFNANLPNFIIGWGVAPAGKLKVGGLQCY